MTPLRRTAIAIAAGLAVADASVVVLALPPILVELDASVEGVAAVIGSYTLALALALLALTRWGARPAAAQLGWIGMLGFAAASAGSGLAPSLGLLVAARGLQGAAAAGVLLAGFELLAAGRSGTRGRRLWTTAAVLGTAIGPVLGGALTELFDWRAIFLAQVPVVAAAGLICRRATSQWAPVSDPAAAGQPRFLSVGAISLGLLSAALTGVLFLVVLLLVSGWAVSPLEAAAVVSTLPLAAFAGMRVPGEPAAKAIVGSTLVGAGVLSLAFLSLDSVAMTIIPQLIAGVGMGMALPAVASGLLAERSTTDAAYLLAARHLGVTVALAMLAPVAAIQLDGAAERVREGGVALVLDANLPLEDKLELAEVATAHLDAIAPRAALRQSLEQARPTIDSVDLDEYERVQGRADEILVVAINEAFARTFLICGALALLAAGGLLASTRPRLGRAAIATCAVAMALVPAQAAIAAAAEPEAVAIADPCGDRPLPEMGGLDGLLQDGALAVLDEAACYLGSSREELVLALVDEQDARTYEDEHGLDPRSPGDLLQTILEGESPPLGRLLDQVLDPWGLGKAEEIKRGPPRYGPPVGRESPPSRAERASALDASDARRSRKGGAGALLPEAGGFEGFLSGPVLAATRDLPFADGVDDRIRQVGLDTALLCAPAGPQNRDHQGRRRRR